jgi:hypothetical protein
VLLGLRHLAAVSATTLLLATLAACGSEDEPEGPLADGSKSASPSAQAAAEPTPPPVPEAGKDTAEARTEFVRWFVDAFGYAFATNDAEPIMEVAATEKSVRCGTCEAFEDYLEERERDGGLVVEPSTYEVKDLFLVNALTSGVNVYTVITDRPAYANVTEDGTVRDRQKADPAYPIEVGIRWGGDGYEITGWEAGRKKQETE